MRLLLPVLFLILPSLADEVRPELVGRDGAGTLWRYGDQHVLVLKGTAREMGRAHGRLLKKEVRENVQAFLHDWALKARGRTRWPSTGCAPNAPARD